VKLHALRGAITCDEDSKAEIDAKTTRLVKEIFARNDLTSDDVVSEQFTLWSNAGAQVVRGNLLVLPIGEDGLLYVQPIFLQADHDQLTAKVLRKPERAEIAAPVQEQLIVELYSK